MALKIDIKARKHESLTELVHKIYDAIPDIEQLVDTFEYSSRKRFKSLFGDGKEDLDRLLIAWELESPSKEDMQKVEKIVRIINELGIGVVDMIVPAFPESKKQPLDP